MNVNYASLSFQTQMESREKEHVSMSSSLSRAAPKRWRWWSEETVAVVTGANKGIGFAVVKRLAEMGLTVILTARDAVKGEEALQTLKSQGLCSVRFFPLDVSDAASICTFASWFRLNFGLLDLLVNNAAVSFNDIYENSVEHAEMVMRTNFYGPKLLTEALLPMFRCSPSIARILNISSRLGLIDKVKNPAIVGMLQDEENLSEEAITSMVALFLENVKDGSWGSRGWPKVWPDYAVSKLALNAYSRVLARRFQRPRLSVNCYCPGFTNTAMTGGRGNRTADAAAATAARLALLPPDDLPTGKFYVENSGPISYSKF